MELPCLNSFAIVNSTASERIEDQIQLFFQFNTIPGAHNDDFMYKKVGLLQAITSLSTQFNHQSRTTTVKSIATDKGRTIMGVLEGGYWFFCEFSFGYSVINSQKAYSAKGLAPNEYLHALIMSGYELWCLNFNSFAYCASKWGKDQFDLKCEQWWKDWFKNTFEFPSSLALNGNGSLKLLKGVRYSCLDLPFGFIENVNLAFKSFVDSQPGVVHISALNTNWSPESNWGVIHSMETDLQLDPIFNWIESIDQSLGLSTYALTYDNIPSIKEYIGNLKRLKSIAPDGTLFERSVIQPAIVLQNTLNEHLMNPINEHVMNPINEHVMNPINDNVINPFVSMMGTVGSYIPGSDYVPNVFSYWPATVQQENTNETDEDETVIDPALGKYILGRLGDDSICVKNVFIKQMGEYRPFKLVAFEFTGILFTLVFSNDHVFQEEEFEPLSMEITKLFETHFQDLIITQMAQLQNLKPEQEDMYVSFENGKIYSTLANIPPFEDRAAYQIPQSHTQYNSLDGDETSVSKRSDIVAKHNLVLDMIQTSNGELKNWKKTTEKLRISRSEWTTHNVVNANDWRIEWHTSS